jgi:peptide/nickel transport system substrate-binding protein
MPDARAQCLRDESDTNRGGTGNTSAGVEPDLADNGSAFGGLEQRPALGREIGMRRGVRWVWLVVLLSVGWCSLIGFADEPIASEEDWTFIEGACLSIGDVTACSATFDTTDRAAVATTRVGVDQDSPIWGTPSRAQKTCEFEKRFTIDAPAQVRLSALLSGTLWLENGIGETGVAVRILVTNAATTERVNELEISSLTIPGRFLRLRTSPGSTSIRDTADRIALLPAGTYVVRASVIAYSEMARGWRNREAVTESTLEVTVDFLSATAVDKSAGEAPDIVVVPLGVSGTSYAHLEPGVPGGTIYVAAITDPKSWNPVTSNENSTSQYTNMMLRGLVDIDPNNAAVVPELAKSWEASDDGLELTFALRRGLRWSDGTPFTADDVVFTYNDLYYNSDIDTNTRDILQLPDGTYPQVERIDDHTVKISLSMPFRPIFSSLGAVILPRHKLARYVHKLNPDVPVDAFNAVWGIDTDPSELVGIGPFVIERYDTDQRVVLRRNAYYYHYDPNGVQLPYVDRYVVQIVQNQDVSLLKFLNHEIHVMAPRAEDVGILMKKADRAGFTVLVDPDVPVFGTSWIGINQDIGLAQETHENLRALFRDIRFREAVAHAIDKDSIIANVYQNLAVPQWSPVSYLSPFYAGRTHYGGPVTEADAVVYEFDLAKATALLDRIGIVDADGDGWRDFADGSPLEIELNTNPNTTRQAICLIVTENLREIGLNVNFQPIDFNTLVTRLTTSMVEMVLLGLDGGSEPNSGANVYRSTGGLHFWHYSAGADDLFDVEMRIDELLAAGVATYNNDEAFEIYKEYQTLYTESDLGLIFTVNPTFGYTYYDEVGNGNVANPIATPSGGNGLTMELVFIKQE